MDITSKSSVANKSTRHLLKLKKLKKKYDLTSETKLQKSICKTTVFDIHGVAKLELSALSQKIISCVVGVHVTAEEPWTYVKKSLIQDNIELHDQSSEFLPLGSFLESYPESVILIGYDYKESIQKDLFFIVYTLEAKHEVFKIIKKQKNELEYSLKTAIHKPVGEWKSLGSEKEVDANLIKNFRPLYEIELTSRFPIVDSPVHFQFRKVEDAVDGYVELLPDSRFTFNNVKRRRIDASVQVVEGTTSREVQTTLKFPTNAYTQYEYEYTEAKTDAVIDKKLEDFLGARFKKLDDDMLVTSNLNMYKDDYANLALRPSHHAKINKDLHIFVCCSDRNHTYGKLVTDIAWYRFLSGTIAVCYTKASPSDVVSKAEPDDEPFESIENACPVLLWTYSDCLHPKLYLQTQRPVTSLSFCPYKENLLVGGCENGQVIIWDITNRLEMVETVEILSSIQKRNRANLSCFNSWMKMTYDKSRVKPRYISTLHDSHSAAVTDIIWVYHDMVFNKCGEYVYRTKETQPTQQFITFSLDGSILVWDILNAEIPDKKFKPHTNKGTNILDTCDNTENQKVLKIKPHFKVLARNADSQPMPLVSMLRKKHLMNYVPRLSSIGADPRARTQFKLASKQDPNKPLPFIVTTATGKVSELKWGCLGFDSGQNLNVLTASNLDRPVIHDGPVCRCIVNNYIENCVLTVGGNCFVIWHIDKVFPIIWRKSKYGKYLSGGWLSSHAGYVVVLRSDGIFEWWDFLFSTKKPIRRMNTGGSLVINLFGTIASFHVTRNTLTITDIYGTVIVMQFPDIFRKATQEENTTTTNLFNLRCEGMTKIKNNMKMLVDKIKLGTSSDVKLNENGGKIETHSKQNIVRQIPSQIENMNKIFSGIQWDSLVDELKYETILRRKKLNIADIEKHKVPLQKIINDAYILQAKQKEIISQKDNILKTTKKKLFDEIHEKKPSPSVSDHVLRSDLTYIADYQQIEERALSFIHANEWHMEYHLSSVIEREELRRTEVLNCLSDKIQHTRRTQKVSVLDSAKISSVSSVAAPEEEISTSQITEHIKSG